MRKLSTLLFTSFFAFASYGQLSGDIVKDNRKMISDQSYIIDGHINGKLVFNISVDIEGKVTSVKVLDSESTIKSTPAKLKAQRYVSEFIFSPGTWYPKHHQGKVVITMVIPK